MNAGGRLTTQRMVELGRVSRSCFYRFDPGAKPTADRDMPTGSVKVDGYVIPIT